MTREILKRRPPLELGAEAPAITDEIEASEPVLAALERVAGR
jgi:hypothetical protein